MYSKIWIHSFILNLEEAWNKADSKGEQGKENSRMLMDKSARELFLLYWIVFTIVRQEVCVL